MSINISNLQPRNCLWCGKPIVRTRYAGASGKLESERSFNQRTFCSRECNHEAQRKVPIKERPNESQ